jgi:GT2 family glycosyltransferase
MFSRRPDIVMITGELIADGIKGPGLAPAEARRRLDDAKSDRRDRKTWPYHAGYGCNMAFRQAVAKDHGLTFDESLPLYGWLEDVDFSQQLARYGKVVKTRAARGVHLGVKSGRQSGVRLGYSQIANPIYLLRKKTCPPKNAFRLMAQNCISNLVRSLAPEPYVDRAGRLRGNVMALFDLARGRLAPQRIESIRN